MGWNHHTFLKLRWLCLVVLKYDGISQAKLRVSIFSALSWVPTMCMLPQWIGASPEVQLPEEPEWQGCHRVGGGCRLHWCGVGHWDSALLPSGEVDYYRFLTSTPWSFASQCGQVLRSSARKRKAHSNQEKQLATHSPIATHSLKLRW